MHWCFVRRALASIARVVSATPAELAPRGPWCPLCSLGAVVARVGESATLSCDGLASADPAVWAEVERNGGQS